ncbi:ATP-binding protein [Mucilaginibacter terrae]|uniref:ATP-binding protein n=1 Tax=Mucilaginibacter terrae TaxID=1955052 RepID=UPI00363BC1EC
MILNYHSFNPKAATTSLLLLFCTCLIWAQTPELSRLKKIKNADSAMLYANELIVAAKQKHDQPQEARILYQQSKIVYRTGDNVKALSYARQALKLTTPADSNTYANSSTMIAYMLSQQGKDVEALNVAFKILRETDTYGWRKLNVYSLACIADLYRGIKNIPKALTYARQAAEGAKALKDTAQYIFTLSTLSNLYSDQNVRTPTSVAKAVSLMNIILSPPYVDLLMPFDKARYLSNLGRLYVIQFDTRAEAVLEKSLAISRAEKFAKLERVALIELTTFYIKQKKYQKAITSGELAQTINTGVENTVSSRKDLLQKLSWAHEGVHNYQKALFYYNKTTQLQDSTLNIDKAHDAAELDKKYKKDKQLIFAAAKTKLVQQQRNFIVVLAILVLAGLIALYRWVNYKRKKQAFLLVQEKEQLEKLDALKTRFFANISHELRTPLTLIMGPADQLLNKQAGNEEQQQHALQAIVRNSRKLLNIVNELLDLGKMESGKLVLKLKPISLAPFINVIYQAFSSAADYKRINYHLNSKIDKSIFVQLDQDKFEKISNNLISNAIKFTPSDGTVTVTASINTSNIEFDVANTGPGIHPNDLPYIFDRYYQGHHANQPLEGGTGIGLAIAREFAELMGGSLTISNTWGAGSTFKVSIPMVTASNYPVEADGDYTPPAYNNKNMNKPLVLIVEDNPEMAGYITSILKPTHTLINAYNGFEALNMLQQMANLPSLIISDAMMPEMDGFTLLTKLKEDAVYCTIPVIMLTALADSRHKLKALHIGVDDYVTKPFLNNELIARVTNLINNAAARLKLSKHDTEELPDDHTPLNNTEDIIAQNEAGLLPPSPADMAWLAELEAEVRKHTGKVDFNLVMLSSAVAISERQLFRRVKQITGLTPNKYIRAIRLQIAREAIESGRYRTISEISYAAGFDTPAYFSKLFKEHYGIEVNDLL